MIMTKSDNKPAFVKRDTIIAGKEYAQLLTTLKERFRRSQIKAAVKVNTTMLEYYWSMGRDISRLHEAAKWGTSRLLSPVRQVFPSLISSMPSGGMNFIIKRM